MTVGDRERTADAASEAYAELLLREIMASPAGDAAGRPLASVYFGGGTPSLLPPRLLARILRTLRERYGMARELECTLEMDPGTFDAERLAAFLEAGVTRVSLGVQSFDQALLTACGRAHTMEDADRALELLGAAMGRGELAERFGAPPFFRAPRALEMRLARAAMTVARVGRAARSRSSASVGQGASSAIAW